MSKDDTRPFPIMAEREFGRSYIPWWLAELAYDKYNKHHDQKLETIAQRGGFSRRELVNLLRGKWVSSDGAWDDWRVK